MNTEPIPQGERVEARESPHKTTGLKQKLLNTALSIALSRTPVTVAPPQIPDAGSFNFPPTTEPSNLTSALASPILIPTDSPAPSPQKTPEVSNVPTTTVSHDQENSQLKSEIENQYGILLISQDLSEAQGINPEIKQQDLLWNTSRIEAVKAVLDILPSRYAQPDDRGKLKIEITGDLDSIDCLCQPTMYDPSSTERKIEFGYQQVDTNNPIEFLIDLTHEMTHDITPIKAVSLDSNYPPYFDSPWYHDIYKLLSSHDSKARLEVINEKLKRISKIPENKRTQQESDLYYLSMSQILPEFESVREIALRYGGYKETDDPKIRQDFEEKRADNIRKGFDDMSHAERLEAAKLDILYGLGYDFAPNFPNEFVAVLAQNYVLGPTFFNEAYAQFFTEEEVNSLHRFTRDTIFEGKEYDNRFTK